MLAFLAEYGMFLLKVATFVVAIVVVIGFAVSAGQNQDQEVGKLKVKKLNRHYQHLKDDIQEKLLSSDELKALDKKNKKKEKEKAKQSKKQVKEGDEKHKPITYVLDFDGDIKASEVDTFREVVSSVLQVATADDEIVVRLESPGGMVHAYGLAASQLARIKSAGVPLTICVDKVAASGGYMMACIADNIIAAPFAVIGSIGVVASIPNFHRVLQKNDVDYDVFTAGQYKRTLTMLGENTDEGREKFKSDLEETHVLFKDFVAEYRPNLNVSGVATGETWYGKVALEKGLIDTVSTSDQYVMDLVQERDVFEVSYELKKTWQEKLGVSVSTSIESSVSKFIASAEHLWDWKR